MPRVLAFAGFLGKRLGQRAAARPGQRNCAATRMENAAGRASVRALKAKGGPGSRRNCSSSTMLCAVEAVCRPVWAVLLVLRAVPCGRDRPGRSSWLSLRLPESPLFRVDT